MSEPTVGGFLDNIWKGLQVIGFIAIAIFAWNYFTGPSSDGLNVGSIEARSNDVRFNIANTSSKEGDVLVFIVQNEIEKCEHVIALKANWRVSNVYLPCRLNDGRFNIRYAWADSMREKAATARRLELNL